MKLREKLAQRSQPFLEPGEQVRYVFLSQTGWSPWLLALTYWAAIFWKYRVVCVTDRAVVVLNASKIKPAQPKDVVARLPRATVIGPLSGLWSKTTSTGEKLYVHKRFHKDVRVADAEIQPAP